MKRQVILIVTLLVVALAAAAQGLERVYDEQIDPMRQIDQAQLQARASGRFVMCQVGGNWCPWCLRFAHFITSDTAIAQVVQANYVYIHVNYNPVHSSDPARDAALLRRLGNPQRFGFPVLVVLDAGGHVLHIQDSSFLEEGKGYNKEKVLRFFNSWTPEAVGAGS